MLEASSTMDPPASSTMDAPASSTMDAPASSTMGAPTSSTKDPPASSSMEPPTNEGDIKPATIEEVKEEGPLFSCNLFDAEMVRKVAQEFLTGLASACVDNTTGGLFKSPASVAVDIRREMVDYLVQRSETFVAESVVLEGGTETVVSDNPFDTISDFIDDFGHSKRNFFSKVSGWILSERREDRIDDFVQEMELNGFWLMGRRETVAQTVIRNVDFKNTFHCNMKFKTEEELMEHVSSCGFREINCENEGCNARFSAAQLEQHDSTCPFKILQCEQKCPEMLMRREMDRHCITVCTMKLVNCSFFPVGCQSTVPQCKADEHRQECLQSHLVYILKLIYKEASLEALQKRAEQLEKAASPPGRLANARDARSLTTAIRTIDAKLGPLEEEKKTEVNSEAAESIDKKEAAKSIDKKEATESIDKKEDGTDICAKKDDGKDSPHKNEKSPDSPKAQQDSTAVPPKVESPAKSENVVEPTNKAAVKEDSTNLSPSKGRSTELPIENEGVKNPVKNVASPKLPKTEESSTLRDENQDHAASSKTAESPKAEEPAPSSPEKPLNVTDSQLEIETHKTKESTPSPKKHLDSTASSPKREAAKSEESVPSPKKHQDSTALGDE